MRQATILVVDDDREIVGAIAKLLELEGHRVLRAYDGLEALEAVHGQAVDLIVLDVMMPRMDGLSATLAVRRQKNVPILLLSAKSEDADKIAGLSIGADDYLTKPYNPMELAARVNALLRRYIQLGAAGTVGPDGHRLVNGGLVLDTDAKTLTVDGADVRLTPTEYKLLAFLMSRPGHVFSAAQLYERVWDEPCYNAENTVMVHIRHLREKIELNPKKPKYLKVVWGLGYKMEKIQ